MQKEYPMDTDLIRAARELPKTGLFRIHEGQGQRIECLAGCLWITQESDPRDVVLEPGQGFTIDRGGETFISALADSRFVLLADAQPGARK
jgi:hypothetical protein